MVALNISADDTSPLILYSPAGAWTDSPSNDTGASSCFQQSSHTSSSHGASATINFNGTGIWFFGTKRPSYGPYNISIDGQSIAGNACSENASFQQLLGGRHGLTYGPHTAVLTNTGSGAPIDLDAVVFETQIGAANATIKTTTIDDTSPDITYLPTPADWAAGTRMQGSHNDTLHYTETGGAQAQLTFDGDAVAIYGTVSPNHANYTVTLDGVTKSFQGGSNGSASHLHTLLYFTDGLTSDSHNLTLTANPVQSGQTNTGRCMSIDWMVVFDTSNNSTTTKGASGSIPTPGQMGALQNFQNSAQGHAQSRVSHRRNVAIIGGVLGGVTVLLLIMLAVVFFRRRPTVQRGRWRPQLTIRQPKTPILPMQIPPPWGMTPQTPEVPNPFSDPEKDVGHPVGVRQEKGNPFADGAWVGLPSVPELSEVQEENDDCQSAKWQAMIKNSARPTVPTRPARPPTLDLPLVRSA